MNPPTVVPAAIAPLTGSIGSIKIESSQII